MTDMDRRKLLTLLGAAALTPLLPAPGDIAHTLLPEKGFWVRSWGVEPDGRLTMRMVDISGAIDWLNGADPDWP